MDPLDTHSKYGHARKDSIEDVGFDDFWPSPTSGNGKVVGNNRRDGAGQGKASFITKAHCMRCGFAVDLNQNDNSGGSLDGNGAGGGISTAVYSATLPNGTIHTESAGTQAYNQGAGCPLCFSKNISTSRHNLSEQVVPFDSIPRAGF